MPSSPSNANEAATRLKIDAQLKDVGWDLADGRSVRWDGRFEAVAASYFIRVRVRRELIHPWYVWAFFNTVHMKRRLFETARGAIGQANINANELKAFTIPLPPLELQAQFFERYTDLEALLAQQERQLAQAEELTHALLARVFGHATAVAT